MNRFQPVVGQRTDRGNARPRNEDAMGGPPTDLDPNLARQKGYLYAVADGMGGEAGGQQASTTAIQSLITEYYRDPEPDVGRSLWRAVQAANQAVYRKARSTPSLSRMGTTLTAVVIRGEDLVVAHVGDSRAYLIRNNDIRQLTRDHSWVADALRAGTISVEEARNHPNRHILTRALGSEPEVQVDVVPEKLRPDDRVLLCSDGLTNLVGDGEILQKVQKQGPLKAPDALIDLANERGGHDNITAMLISVPGGRKPVPPPPSPGVVPWPVFGGFLAVLVVLMTVLGIRELISKPQQEAAATQTAVAQATVTQMAAMAATETAVAATQIAVAQPTATETVAPTATPTEVPTATPIEVPTATPIEVPTVTPTETPTPTPTSTATPRPTPTATRTATPTPMPAPSIKLVWPANGAQNLLGLVTFRWTWSGEELEPGEVFDVKVCQGEGCQLQKGKTNTRDTKWENWCPDLGQGVYRWKVEVIDKTTHQPKDPASEEWKFTWVGRREVKTQCIDKETNATYPCNEIVCH